MKDAMFKDVPGAGDLRLVKVLFEYDFEPIAFVCENEKEDLYYCVCDDFIDGRSYLITRVSEEELAKVSRSETTALEPFKASDSVITADEEAGFKFAYRVRAFSDIEEDELPGKDPFLPRQNAAAKV